MFIFMEISQRSGLLAMPSSGNLSVVKHAFGQRSPYFVVEDRPDVCSTLVTKVHFESYLASNVVSSINDGFR